MIFGRFVNAVATLAFLMTLRAVVLNVALEIFPRQLLLQTYIASDGLKRATAEMRLELIGRERHHLAMVGTVHGALAATLSDMADEVTIRDC